jgi:hypothetical protein
LKSIQADRKWISGDVTMVYGGYQGALKVIDRQLGNVGGWSIPEEFEVPRGSSGNIFAQASAPEVGGILGPEGPRQFVTWPTPEQPVEPLPPNRAIVPYDLKSRQHSRLLGASE